LNDRTVYRFRRRNIGKIPEYAWSLYRSKYVVESRVFQQDDRAPSRHLAMHLRDSGARPAHRFFNR